MGDVMTPFYQFSIGRAIVSDGIFLMKDSAANEVFIRAQTADDMGKLVADLRKMADELEGAIASVAPTLQAAE